MSAEFSLKAGGYEAVVTEHAAALRVLRFDGRDLVVPFPEGGPIPDYRGIIAAPWPNRIADGRYTFDGVTHQLPLNEPERGCSLHGLVFSHDWTMVARDESRVAFTCIIPPGKGYPHKVRLAVDYRLSEGGLLSTITATNLGTSVAPYGVCPHPYLVAGPSPLNDWVLELPAKKFLQVTADRLLPTTSRSVDGHEYDFRFPKPIGAVAIDHAFTDLAFDGTGWARVLLRDPSGTGVALAWDKNSPWVQLHTADKAAPFPSRLGLAVEPMTCPPNAFITGEDLIRLLPGGNHRMVWSISAA